MTKAMKCGDVVPGCDHVVRGKTEEEVMEGVAQHAKEDHGMIEIPESVLVKVKSAIHDEY